MMTGADALRVYLTGADSDGGANARHDRSTGGYRSSARLQSLTVHRPSMLRALRVDYVSGANGAGLASILVNSAGAIAWAAPGEDPGDYAAIANGETVIVRGDTANKYAIISRISAEPIGGGETLQLLETADNVLAPHLLEYPQTEERAIMIRNDGDANITSLTVQYIRESGESAYAFSFAVETPTDDEIQTAPTTGLSYQTSATVNVGTLAPGEMRGIWIRRVSSETPIARMLGTLRFAFTYGGAACVVEERGVSRTGTGTAAILLWIANGEDPDTSGAATLTLADELPVTIESTDYAWEEAHDYHIAMGRRNRYGLVSINPTVYRLGITDDGEQYERPPSGPAIVSLTPAAEGKATITAAYFPALEDPDPIRASAIRANNWLLYVRGDGTDPDPDVDEPTVQAMGGSQGYSVSRGGVARPTTLTVLTADGFLEDAPIRVIVRTRRDDDPLVFDSDNEDIYEVAAQWWGPARINPVATQGRARGLHVEPTAYDGETVMIDEANNVYWECVEGATRLWADDVLVFNLRGDQLDLPGNGIYTTFAIINDDIDGEASEVVEIGTWDGSNKQIYISVNGTRRMLIDAELGTIRFSNLYEGATATTAADQPIWPKFAATCMQFWGVSASDWMTGSSINSDGRLNVAVPWKQMATQAECL